MYLVAPRCRPLPASRPAAASDFSAATIFSTCAVHERPSELEFRDDDVLGGAQVQAAARQPPRRCLRLQRGHDLLHLRRARTPLRNKVVRMTMYLVLPRCRPLPASRPAATSDFSAAMIFSTCAARRRPAVLRRPPHLRRGSPGPLQKDESLLRGSPPSTRALPSPLARPEQKVLTSTPATPKRRVSQKPGNCAGAGHTACFKARHPAFPHPERPHCTQALIHFALAHPLLGKSLRPSERPVHPLPIVCHPASHCTHHLPGVR